MLTQADIKNLMGAQYFSSYRGNHYANEKSEDLLNDKKVLDAVNALGHRVWNIENLDCISDLRLIPIILSTLGNYENLKFEDNLLAFGLSKPIYKDAIPSLIERYKSIQLPKTMRNEDLNRGAEYKKHQLRFRIGDCAYSIKCADYIEDYLELITKDEYVIGCEQIIGLLYRLKERRALAPSLKLLRENPMMYRWVILSAIGWYRDPELISHIEPFVRDSDGEIRQMAKKAIERLKK